MAQNDWTVVSETPATAASGWEVASEAVTSYKNLEPVGEPVDYSAAATAMEGTPSEAPPRKQYTGSIFDTVKLPEPEFDPREAERLSRREYAQRTARPPARTQYLEPTPEDQITRSAARSVVDTTIGILQGAVAIPKGIVDNIPGDNPLSKFFQSAIDAGERAKSPYLRNQAFNRAALLDRVRQNQGELAASRAAFNTLFSPAGADIIAQGGGSLLPTVGLSWVGLGATSLAAMNALANAGDAAQQTAARLADMPPEQWSNSSLYQNLRESGMGHRDAVRMLAPIYALPAQTVGGVTGAISGATGLERALVRGGGSRLGRAAAELAGEEAETLTPMVTANATRMLLDDKQKLFEGTGQAAVETAAGSVPGAALAAAARPGRKPAPPTAAQLMEEKGFGADQWEVVSQEPIAPPAPVAAPVAPAPVTTTTMREQQRAVEDLEAAIEGEPIGLEAPEAVQAEAQREEEPAAAVEGALPVFTGKVRLAGTGDQYGASVGSVSNGTRRQLMVDPNGGYFWGDYAEASERDVGLVKQGEHSNLEPAVFNSSKEAKEAAKNTPQTKQQPAAAVTEPPTEPMEIEPLPEQLAGERKPMAPEDQAALDEANKKLDELERDVRRLQNNKGRSLWTALKNRLSESELVDLGESDKLRFLKAGKNKKPTTISDLIHDRTLDDFLPYDMRPDSPTYDIQESEEYIKDKIRKQSYRTFDSDIALRNMMDASAQLDRLIRKELNLDEINAEIQAAIDEQREADRALEEPAPAGEVEAVGRGEEEGFLTAPTEAELRAQDERLRREAEEAARREAAPPPEEFTLTGSKRAADEAAARGQRELAEEAEAPPTLDTTGQPEIRGRHPQVVAAGRLFKAGKMSREDFEKYVDYYYPIKEVEPDKVYEPASEDKIREALREGDKAYLGVPIADGTRVGLRMDIPALRKGVPVVSIHEGKRNINPKTGKPYTSAGKRISYAPTGYITDVEFAPRDQYKSLEMGIEPAKEPLQTVEGVWVNKTPQEVFAKVKELMGQPGWTQIGFDPSRHGYFYDRKTKQPVVSADEVYQVGNFLLAKNVEYAPKEQFLYSIEPVQDNANFRRWFGDSKVVDENGAPLVVYHHTPENFSEFIPGGRDPELSGVAIWMTPETEVSKAPFAHQLYSALRQGRGIDAKGNLISADAVRMLESGRLTEQQAKVIRKRVDEAIDAARVSGVNTMPLYASIKNPLILRGKESSKATLMYPDRVKELKAQGYDGVMAYDDNNALIEVVAFEPNQVKSATGNRGTFGPEADITLDISAARSEAGDTSTRSPSVKRKVRTLNNQRKAGRLTDEQFAEEVDAALEADEAEKYRKPIPERARGADFIRQKLLEAKRRGEISEEAVDFAEWFIRQNERLVDDLGVAIRKPKVPGTAGFYSPFQRIMALMKETAGDQTVVHEILHHLERMMPAEVQQAIRKAWLRELAAGQKKATKDSDRLFFALMDNHHFGSGDIADVDFARAPLVIRRMMQNGELDKQTGRSMDAAIALLRNGAVPMDFYQYVNPSEFWAVNASDIMKGRFDAVRGGVLARLKNWLKELAERTKDLFGMRSDAPLIRALDSLMKGDGKFVSKKMLIDGDTFLQIGKNIYSRTPLVNWTTPDETKLDDFIYKLQDKQIDLKRATQEIEKSAGQLEDRWSPYLQEELYHGRTARATANFLREEVRPLLQEMQKEGVSIGELEEYLHNRHTEERNDQIAQINDLMPDGGAGIMTADAQSYLAGLTPEQKAKYERLAQMVDGITQGTRDYLIESGLEEEATVRQWEKTYKNYVPLNREDVEYSTSVGAGTGRGYSVRGPASRRATGSERAVVDILPNIIMQRERAIVRGEKNRVATALYGLAIQNPNPEVWLAVNPEAKQSRKRTVQELIDMGLTAQDAEGLMQEPAQKVVDPNTGLVTQRVNPVLRGANNVLAARINGKDRYVFFNTVNPRAQRMALSLLNMDADQLGTALTMVARATRYMSNINTQYNPIFGPYNFLRDVQGAAIQLDGTPIEDKRKEVLWPTNVAGAMRGIYQALRAERKEQPVKGTDWSKLWLEFQKEGGQTGYRDMFSRSQERADSLKKELDRLNEGPVKKTALATPRWILDWLSDYNETLENAVRLSAYKAALDKGLSKEQAASVAKNLTVNFNRKGQIGVQAGAWYSFFNSAVQGTARMLGTIAKMERPGDLKSIRLRPIGQAVIYGGLSLGAAQALGLWFMGYDENEPPEFVKDRNVILPIGDGKYLAWPLPLGYHVIPAIGRILTEWAISGGKDTSKRVAHLTSLIFDAFNPIGNAGWSFQSVAPTIFDPVVALFENRDWTGKRIAKEDFNKLDPTPGYTRARENASRIGKEVSYYLNLMSGGDKDVKGVISPTPDQIDYLIGQAFGGLGREALKVAKTAEATVTGEELAPYNIPLAGRFYGNTKAGYAESSKFYRNIERLNTLENQIQGRQKRGESTADFVKENPEVRLIAASNQIERNISALRKRKEKLIKDGAPRASVRAVENQITAQMKRLNEKMDELEKQKR